MLQIIDDMRSGLTPTYCGRPAASKCNPHPAPGEGAPAILTLACGDSKIFWRFFAIGTPTRRLARRSRLRCGQQAAANEGLALPQKRRAIGSKCAPVMKGLRTRRRHVFTSPEEAGLSRASYAIVHLLGSDRRRNWTLAAGYPQALET